MTISAASHHMKVDYNPYEGRTVRGAPAHVFLRGRRVVTEGRFTGRAGGGTFLKRSARSA